MVRVSMEEELSKAIETRAVDQIRYLQSDIGGINRIREENPDNWEIQELTRAIIHEEAQLIQSLQMEAENARAARKEFERV